MSRRGSVAKRVVLPDPVYGSIVISKLVHAIMMQGKKSVAERIVYNALEVLAKKTKMEPVEAFTQALRNVKPTVEVRSRRIGGATYQVPVEVRDVRSSSLALRWIVSSSKKRPEPSMEEKLAAELLDAVNNRGSSVKIREEKRRMAEANKAFTHFRW
jgi:small subunit ribosomal protein S7